VRQSVLLLLVRETGCKATAGLEHAKTRFARYCGKNGMFFFGFCSAYQLMFILCVHSLGSCNGLCETISFTNKKGMLTHPFFVAKEQ